MHSILLYGYFNKLSKSLDFVPGLLILLLMDDDNNLATVCTSVFPQSFFPTAIVGKVSRRWIVYISFSLFHFVYFRLAFPHPVNRQWSLKSRYCCMPVLTGSRYSCVVLLSCNP